jgi:hypothetical protein
MSAPLQVREYRSAHLIFPRYAHSLFLFEYSTTRRKYIYHLFDRNRRIFAPTIPHTMKISTVLAGTALTSMAATASQDKVAVGSGPYT